MADPPLSTDEATSTVRGAPPSSHPQPSQPSAGTAASVIPAAPRSVPPPLPAHALKPGSEPPPTALDRGLESEIDDALGGLELGGPSASTLSIGVLARSGGSEGHDAPAAAPLHSGDGSFHPVSTREDGYGREPVTGKSSETHEELESGELESVEDATEAGLLGAVVGSTPPGPREEEIVIADDLAEEVSDDSDDDLRAVDDEEHTDAGAPVPPLRSDR